jgi:hypothetical protein
MNYGERFGEINATPARFGEAEQKGVKHLMRL